MKIRDGYLLFIAMQLYFVTVYAAASPRAVAVRLDNAFSQQQRQDIQQWLDFAVESLKSVYGELPQDQLALHVYSAESKAALALFPKSMADKYRRLSPMALQQIGPVPWGEVIRENPVRVNLVVNARHKIEVIQRDWTVYHELSHLLIPYSGQGAAWFSEGLASYYQNITQARVGLLTEQQLWQKLYDGFERGRLQNQFANTTLALLSAERRKNRAFMRIYWSGAHYWFEADLWIRQHSDNKASLDSLLWRLKQCCQADSLSGLAIANKLDEIYGEPFFAPSFRAYSKLQEQPRQYRTWFPELGLSVQDGVLVIDTKSKFTELRRSFLQGYVAEK